MSSLFVRATEIAGWILIFLSPTLIGIGIGYGIYYYFQNLMGIIIGILIAIMGFTIGIFWATKMYNRTGTIAFLSNVIATPELDAIEKSKTEDANSGK